MLKGKSILLCITGGIAAYKMANVASALVKLHADVNVIMTLSASKFITPITFEAITKNHCYVDTFDNFNPEEIHHIALSEKSDILLVSPATADICAKIAHGIADDIVSTTVLAATCPKLIAPSMNTNMFCNPVTQDNIKILEKYNWKVIQPSSGRLACGTSGKGKLPEPETLVEYILKEIAFTKKDFLNKKVLVTAGATQESIDPVRYITNHSSGKMGYAIAKMAMLRGADVTLITGKTSITPPPFVNVIEVTSAQDMYEKVCENFDKVDFVFKAAAVADYTPSTYSDNKIKKHTDAPSISLKRTKDILEFLGTNKKENQVICGFSMETENMIENSKIKLIKKNLDMICANNLKTEGAGFQTDTNVITIITKSNDNFEIKQLPLMTKEEAALEILSKALEV